MATTTSNSTGKSREAEIFLGLERESSYLFLQLHQARAEKVLHCCQLSYTFKNKSVFLVVLRVRKSPGKENQNGKLVVKKRCLFRLWLSEEQHLPTASAKGKGCVQAPNEHFAV